MAAKIQVKTWTEMQQMENRGFEEKDLTICCGYEVPKCTTRLARRILKKLREHNMVIFQTDDGITLPVVEELKNIAGAIGIKFYEEQDGHCITLVQKKPSVCSCSITKSEEEDLWARF